MPNHVHFSSRIKSIKKKNISEAILRMKIGRQTMHTAAVATYFIEKEKEKEI